MPSLVPPESAERCEKSPTGWHCDCWYEQDEPCHHCGTNDLNVWIDGEQVRADGAGDRV